eukprot:3063405-Pyramimonas_sp.AAC.1
MICVWNAPLALKFGRLRLTCDGFLFRFSLVWTVGGDVDEDGRKKFDTILRKLLVGDVPSELKPYMKGKEQKVTQLFPEGRQ